MEGRKHSRLTIIVCTHLSIQEIVLTLHHTLHHAHSIHRRGSPRLATTRTPTKIRLGRRRMFDEKMRRVFAAREKSWRQGMIYRRQRYAKHVTIGLREGWIAGRGVRRGSTTFRTFFRGGHCGKREESDYMREEPPIRKRSRLFQYCRKGTKRSAQAR